MTREERIADINKKLSTEVPKGQTSLVEQNIITVESLVDNTIRIEELVLELKQNIMPDGFIERLIGHALVGTTPQLMHSMSVILKCMPELTKFDECMETFIPAMGTLAAIFEQQKDLAELEEAIK